jgi:NAD-dependent DNA ligase
MVLQHAGFEVAWNKYTNVTEKTLMELMQRRRQEGLYGIDGIVVCEPGFPVQVAATDQYPSDAVAFKMPLADQMATTKVQEIDWNVGRAGVWTPRLRIAPVVIGGAKIEWVTGHNAGWIRDRGLGIGAEVIIRRSGDVIPIIDSVLKQAPITTWPEGTWDGVHLIYGKAENIMTIVHAIELMGVKQCGKERLNKLNVSTLKELFELPEAAWASEIGPGIGPKLRTELHQKAKEIDGIIKVMCYPFLPSAVGRKRIQTWSEHNGSGRPQGWGEDTWKEFSDMLPTINVWIAGTFPYKTTTKAVVVKTAPVTANGNVMTMTGFRDDKLKAAAEAKGWMVADLSKKTTHLIIKEGYENKKTEKARADGITIWTVGDAYRILEI